MAINSAAGFSIGSSDPIDDRLVLTKEQMLGINENTMPDVYFANCKDDGYIYVFNKTNTIDPVTGKFRKVASDSVVEVENLPAEKENVVYKISGSEVGTKKIKFLTDSTSMFTEDSLIPDGFGMYMLQPSDSLKYNDILFSVEEVKKWEDATGEGYFFVKNCELIEDKMKINSLPAYAAMTSDEMFVIYIFDEKNEGKILTDLTTLIESIMIDGQKSIILPKWYTRLEAASSHLASESFEDGEWIYDAITRKLTSKLESYDSITAIIDTELLPDASETSVYAKDVKLLTEFDTDKLGNVKTVNNNEPDENGNITVDVVKEVSTLPEEKENVIYKIVDDTKKVYTDIGTLEVVQVPGSYIGDLYVPIMAPFTCDVDGIEYDVSPSEEMKFIFGSETEFPAIAYIIDTNRNQLQFRGVSNKEEIFVLRKVDVVPQTTDVYAKDVRLLTENDANIVQAVKEVDVLPEELQDVVYKVGASGSSANELNFITKASVIDPSIPSNIGLLVLYVPKENMLNIDHISMSYKGFNNRQYNWIETEEYSYYNIEPKEDGGFNFKGFPAFIIYRESTIYSVYALCDKNTSHYFETDAPASGFINNIYLEAQQTIAIPPMYGYYQSGYSSESLSLLESFETEDVRYSAATRELTNKQSSSGTYCYFLPIDDSYLNPLSSDSFNQIFETSGVTYNVLGGKFNDEVTSFIANGDSYLATQDMYKNYSLDTGPTDVPAYAFDANTKTFAMFQSPSSGVFVKPSDNKIWVEMTYSDNEPVRYIPTCVTRIKDHDDIIHSTDESFRYEGSSGFIYDASTRTLDTSIGSSDIFISFEVPAPVGNLTISSTIKVYAKDIELAPKTSLEKLESKVDGKLSSAVTLDTSQNITGNKTFNNIKVDGIFQTRTISGNSGAEVLIDPDEIVLTTEKDYDEAPPDSISVSMKKDEIVIETRNDGRESSVSLDGHTINAKVDAAKINDKNIVRSVQGNEADANGSVEITSLTELLAKVPTEASATNQLADKSYVNDAVSSGSSNYISDNGNPFTSIEALNAYTGTVTHNDYAFVTGTDEAGNTYYDRYKASVTTTESGKTVSWAKEYRLNNSSFTQGQWDAINSGITALLYNGASRYVQDAGASANKIEIAYSGTGLTKDTATHFVAWGAAEHDDVSKTMRDMSAEEAGKFIGKVNNAANADNATNATNAGALSGFSKTDTQGWGVQTGEFITGMSDGAGGDLSFRKNCPSAGQTSLVLDGTVYVQEGMKEVATKDAVGNVKGTFSGGVLTLNLL